jgi:hypothetical protein
MHDLIQKTDHFYESIEFEVHFVITENVTYFI